MPNSPSKDKDQLGIWVDKKVSKKLRELARKDRRNLGQEFEYIFEEWYDWKFRETHPPYNADQGKSELLARKQKKTG